jgi:hypothetical protein
MVSEKLYPIAPEVVSSGEWSRWADCWPGTTPDGEQLIVCWDGRRVYSHRFSADGEYLGRTARAAVDRATALARVKELGLTPATIRVRKFHSGLDSPTPDGFDGPTLAIYEQPSVFEDGDLGTPEQREVMLRWWRDLGAFVLFWDTTEHTLDGKGVRFQ